MLAFSAIGSTKKQVVATAAVNGTVIYAVPAGRTFTGNMIAPTNATAALINSVVVPIPSAYPIPVTFVGGSVIALAAAYQLVLIGVEE